MHGNVRVSRRSVGVDDVRRGRGDNDHERRTEVRVESVVRGGEDEGRIERTVRWSNRDNDFGGKFVL